MTEGSGTCGGSRCLGTSGPPTLLCTICACKGALLTAHIQPDCINYSTQGHDCGHKKGGIERMLEQLLRCIVRIQQSPCDLAGLIL